jgi:hypothetical protein
MQTSKAYTLHNLTDDAAFDRDCACAVHLVCCQCVCDLKSLRNSVLLLQLLLLLLSTLAQSLLGKL